MKFLCKENNAITYLEVDVDGLTLNNKKYLFKDIREIILYEKQNICILETNITIALKIISADLRQSSFSEIDTIIIFRNEIEEYYEGKLSRK